MQFGRQILISLLLLSFTKGYSQGKINAPAIECLGNITGFTYTPPSGKTVSSINWDFGDGFNSTNTSTTHSYANIGKYTVKANVSFTNSTTTIDSMLLEVVGIPKAHFYYVKSSDTCFLSNIVCFRDTSSPAKVGQSIVSRLMVWGDGSFNTFTNPVKFDTVCHTYSVPDKYTVKIEVTDKYGCKNSANLITNVVENIRPNFSVTQKFVDCNTLNICVKNASTQATPANSHYKWYVDTFRVDTGFYFTNTKCFQFKKSKNINIRLIANANNYCIDTLDKSYFVNIDSLPTFMTLMDTVRCFGDYSQNQAILRNINRDDIKWYLDNAWFPLVTVNEFYFNTKQLPGWHQVKVEVIRGSCTHTVTKNYRVIGPLARMQVYDNYQCFSDREVFMYESSLGINRNKCTFKWVIDDPNGDNCINWRTKEVNKNKNCNFSADWWTRHKFAKNSVENVEAFVVITDTVTGCFDTARTMINMKFCSKILKPDTIVVCQGDLFLDQIPTPYPYKFTIDSGKLWRKFPEVLDAPLKGFYDVGYVFESVLPKWTEKFGDDSFRLRTDTLFVYDTIYRKQLVYVVPPIEDTITVTAYSTCRPFHVSLHFKHGNFKKGEKLEIFWADSGNIDTTFRANVHIDSIVHIYNKSGFDAPIMIKMTNIHGCSVIKRLEVTKGFVMSYYIPKVLNCKSDSVCFYPGVYNFKTATFWSGNTPNNRVKWDIPDAGGSINKFNPCVRFNKGGLLPFRMVVTDSFGCKDTMQDSIFVQDVRANVKTNSKIVYCSELKQFFDSSSFYRNPKWRPFLPAFFVDTIKKHSWQFGDGTFSSLQKNPLQTLNTSLDSIIASHAVETVNGCKDTFKFVIKVIGPKPYFNIKDTIGCNSLNAEFVNLSRNCKNYIWSFGDSLNSTLQKNDKNNVTFNYTKPGRYYISLVGIDTIFNPFTNKYQSCFNTFPDKLFQKDTHRTVLVLPLKSTGITSRDTVCIGETVVFNSKSDTSYLADIWDFGDTATIDTSFTNSSSHRYKKAGIYQVKLNPRYLDAIKDQCLDSASKSVLVLGVKSSFTIDPNSKPPLFQFHNTSQPNFASLKWDFGQVGSPNSSDNDPSYNYGIDTGRFWVCLIATIPFGCADTSCQLVISDYISDFKMFNVITPGLEDGKNDQFDVVIEGESLYDLQIYNRWGILVYQSNEDADNSQNKNWNGKVLNTGADCPSGTYYYLFNYALKTNPQDIKTVQGVITLIR